MNSNKSKSIELATSMLNGNQSKYITVKQWNYLKSVLRNDKAVYIPEHNCFYLENKGGDICIFKTGLHARISYVKPELYTDHLTLIYKQVKDVQS